VSRPSYLNVRFIFFLNFPNGIKSLCRGPGLCFLLADSTVIDDDDEMLFGDDTELVSLSLPLATGQPYNRSITDPGSKQQKLSVFRARRMRTNPVIQASTVRGSAETIATATFKTIIQNMEQYGLRTSHLWQHNFHWLLPKSGATQQQLKIFCALRDHPLIVPNGDLVRILDLEQSTESSPPTPLGTHFYVRSFELTHYQLTKVIKFMAKQDVLLSEAVHWETTLLIHRWVKSKTWRRGVRYSVKRWRLWRD
jgi:hypothetical protein